MLKGERAVYDIDLNAEFAKAGKVSEKGALDVVMLSSSAGYMKKLLDQKIRSDIYAFVPCFAWLTIYIENLSLGIDLSH